MNMEYLSIPVCHLQFFFIRVFYFLEYKSFISLHRFILRYLIVFGAAVNGIDSLISLSSASLLVWRNAPDFYTWILLPAA